MQTGDLVLTRNQNDPNAPIEQRQVTAVSVHTMDYLLRAEGTTETIRTTDEHPFWVTGFGSFKAGDLQVFHACFSNAAL